jgi:hypothetical protein
MKTLIAAVGKGGVIGGNGTLLWNNYALAVTPIKSLSLLDVSLMKPPTGE